MQSMKNESNEKLVKNALNEALSKTVKLLQTKAKIEGDAVVQSDNEPVQQFIPVLEAAFIHGLKINYYEKQKHQNDLPKPQFWSLICKISHKNTLEQIRKLNYVRTNVGRCRAWLRLTLNEFALTSYLAALLQSSEYAELLVHYYDAHALFRDGEQRDIFMSYLQGTENLTFELVCNSSILDAWTRTPLELSDVLPSNVARKQFTSAVNSMDHLSATLKEARSFDSLNSSLSSKDESASNAVKDSFQSSYESATSLISVSSSDVSAHPAIEVETVEEPVEAGEPTTSQLGKEDNLLAAVLYERHLSTKRRRSKHKHEDGRLTPQSRCSSSSSISNSHLDESLEIPQDMTQSREPAVDDRKDVTETASSRAESPCPPPSQSDPAISTSDATEVSSATVTPFDNDRATSPFPKQDVTALSHKNGDYDDVDRSDTGQNQFKLDETDSNLLSAVENEFSSNLSDRPSVLLHENHSSETSSSHEDIDDIYAEDISRSRTDSTLLSSLSGSPGFGNSLLCSLGWSSETDEKTLASQPVIRSQPPASNDNHHSELNEDEELMIRAGLLQKKSFGIWRTRWFVLTTTTLLYYKDQGREEQLGVIRLNDVQTIDDKSIEKKKTMSLLMLNGDDHQVGATSSKVLSGWAEDLSDAVKNIQEHSVKLNEIETTYVVLESTEIDGPAEPKSSNERSNTSWGSTMRNHITRIATEKGLDAQNYQCADCAAPIGILYGEARVCHFTGQYYCPQCHLNEEYQIPARMIHNWDFKKHKVSKRSKTFLISIWKEPCIDLNRVNPIAYRYLDELRKLLPLRTKLSAVYPYVNTCRIISTKQLVSILRSHYYMMENPHVYSAYDLQKTRGKSLPELLNKALTFAIQHVTSCHLCSSKGHLCEVCNKNEIIYAFQTEITHQCEDCKTVYHKACLPDISKCRKCERRHRRLQAEQVDDDDFDSAYF